MQAFDPRAVAGDTRGGIDKIDYVDGCPGLVPHVPETAIPRGAPLVVSGWAVDPETKGTPATICVLLDATRDHITRSAESGGFRLAVTTADLRPGSHELRAFALSTDGFWYEFATAGFVLYEPVFPTEASLPRALSMTLQEAWDLDAGRKLAAGVPIRANHRLMVRGWSFDRVLGTGAAGIVAFDDGNRWWSGPADIECADVGTALGSDRRFGFEIVVPAAISGPGEHCLHVAGFDAAGRRYANTLDVHFRVISASFPYPLAARATASPPAFAAQLRARDDDDTDDRPLSRHALPARAPLQVRRTTVLTIEGWAVDETGVAADEVFIEVSPSSVPVIPWRLLADCGRRHAAAGVRGDPPAADAWWRCEVDTTKLYALDYDLAIAVVQPGRRTVSRALLAILRVA